MSRHIRSWSGIHKAQANYTCVGCGELIPIGQVHHSFVMSDDSEDPAHTAYRIRHHLDCNAPWYQPSDVNRLHHVGRIPRAEPPTEAHNALLEDLPALDIRYRSKSAGTISWKLPKELSRRILYYPNLSHRAAALFELQMALATHTETLALCASNMKKSKAVGELLYDIQLKSSFVPRHYDWDMDLEEDQ